MDRHQRARAALQQRLEAEKARAEPLFTTSKPKPSASGKRGVVVLLRTKGEIKWSASSGHPGALQRLKEIPSSHRTYDPEHKTWAFVDRDDYWDQLLDIANTYYAHVRTKEVEDVVSFSKTSFSTLYNILGVDEDATAKEIKKAYFNLSARYHPDRVAHMEDKKKAKAYHEKFLRINDAYRTLSDDAKRRKYDAARRMMQRRRDRDQGYKRY